MDFPLCPHRVEGARELSGAILKMYLFMYLLIYFYLLYKGTNPMRFLHDLMTSQRPHILVPSHWMLGFQHMILRGHKHLDHRGDPLGD